MDGINATRVEFQITNFIKFYIKFDLKKYSLSQWHVPHTCFYTSFHMKAVTLKITIMLN